MFSIFVYVNIYEYFTFNAQVEVMMQVVSHYRWTYISVLYLDDSYGKGAAKLIRFNFTIACTSA